MGCTKPNVCGDGDKSDVEACDDGNTMNNDGCSSNCIVETGWACTGTPKSNCTQIPGAICGNAIVENGEGCDDGNVASNDGCASNCQVEANYNCTGTPKSTCVSTLPIPVCGDGKIESGEACDDGNMSNGDGCNNTCTVQSGWSCTGSPSVCSNTLSVGEVSNQGVFNINVAPNPVTDKLHIQFFLSNKSNAEIVILDVSGKQVFQTKNTNLIVGSNDLEIVIKDKLSPGIYLLNMRFSNDKVVTKKIMIK